MIFDRRIWTLTFKNLRWRFKTFFLSLVALALCNALVLGLIHVTDVIEKRATHLGQQFDLIIGAKDSPPTMLWHALSLDSTTNTEGMPADYGQQLWSYPEVSDVLAITTGESHRQWPVIGVSDNIFKSYAFGELTLADSHHSQDKTGIILGADVAQISGYKVGEYIQIGAGRELQADDIYPHALRITGILEKHHSPVDRLMLTTIDEIITARASHDEHGGHDGHAEHDEHNEFAEHDGHGGHNHDDPHGQHDATFAHEGAVVHNRHPLPGAISYFAVKLNDRSSLLPLEHNLPDQFNGIKVIVPSMELEKLSPYMEIGQTILFVLIAIALAISLLAVFLAISKDATQREQDLQTLKMLGLHPKGIITLSCLEPLLVITASVILGYLIYIAMIIIGQLWLPILLISPWSSLFELFGQSALFIPFLILQNIAILIPACQLNRIN